MSFTTRFLYSFVYLLFVIPFLCLLRGLPAKNSLKKLNSILEGIKKGQIAHRGGIPENTLTAFRKSKRTGATTVEVDLQMTKDGHPVLFHDDETDELCNGSGQLKDMTMEDVKILDIKGYPDAKIPTLHEAIDVIKEEDMYMLLEIKDYNSQTLNIITNLFKNDDHLYERIIVISFFPHIIYQVKRSDSNIMVGLVVMQTLLVDEAGPLYAKWKLKLLSVFDYIIGKIMIGSFVRKLIGLSLILPDKDDIILKRIDIKHLEEEGVRLITWTVNSDEDKEYFNNNLHHIPYMTDHVTSSHSPQ
ncbi:PREDICTED: glycerophosphodiester phosphodiesterase 1-like [Amphimedon queenslandica]|uniref:GP-PDE domain-containing protein n=1 Tax=Amphimedon queenslandica TaxID=400682 RepID=A0A1X7UAB4_AMPQE|nr:PREDICTED: glycerophosphodiester phosphodiesterase 1-like [Amphimedon queenslandica]|eukprot:XP_003388488.1 PREDICTED: glycerophosphodiester phosphodiesterase 1-like [Amphimedon queenslandica]